MPVYAVSCGEILAPISARSTIEAAIMAAVFIERFFDRPVRLDEQFSVSGGELPFGCVETFSVSVIAVAVQLAAFDPELGQRVAAKLLAA